jgi:ATP-dependent exoDNAse (exonuclease V) beta subunit
MRTPLADQAERDRIQTGLDRTMVVEAAAGTGKTSALVSRMVGVLVAGRARLGQMVAVTFTDAAAGELKLRLRAEVERARSDAGIPEASAHALTDALRELEEARIGTIHSFCADLLREQPVEAGVDPLFEVAAKDVEADLLGRAFDHWFAAELANPSEGVRRFLRRTLRGRPRGEEGPRAALRSAAASLAERRDFPAAWRRDPFAREPEIDALMEEVNALGALAAAGDPRDYFTKSLVEIERFASEVSRREAIRGRDYDGLEAELTEFSRERNSHWRWKGSQWARSPFDRAEVRRRRDRLCQRLRAFAAASGADLAPRLRDDLWPVVMEYERLKERAGYLDFMDLLLRARDLLRGNETVRRELQARFTHIFVDEFQDTDPLQLEILMLLVADDPAETDWRRVRPVPGKLFLIADPKQSIYRFRRADVALFEVAKRKLQENGAELVPLSVSFRAVPELQEVVNTAFAPRLSGSAAGQAAYVPLMPWRSDVEDQPVLVALPVPAPYGDYKPEIVDWKIRESLPDTVAAFVHWLVHKSGWTVTERGSPEARLPVSPRHVCLLFRRFRSNLDDATRPYVRALEARGLPHVLVGGGSFHRREEVEALRNALTAIERPDDELMVFATLRGPLFALSDGALIAFREEIGSLHPFRQVPEDLKDPLRDVAGGLALLRSLHRSRNHRPIADTIGRLLAATRAHAGLAIWPTGEQALANVTRLMDLARRAERSGVLSFRAFVTRLADDAERGEASEAPTIEEGTEGVRIMTVHRAKGLEFPVVVLADLTVPEIHQDPDRYVDAERGLCAMRLAGCLPPELQENAAEERERERDEALRVLYVAATRARDLLVVPAVGDGRQDGWMAALNPVLYPPESRAGTAETRKPPGCPDFGVDSVPGRPRDVAKPKGSVAPGLHRPEVGSHRVVWWDPSVLALNVPESLGLRQERLLHADESRRSEEAGIRAHAAWQEVRAAVRAQGGTESVRVVTATERAREPNAAAVEVAIGPIEVEAVAHDRPRPHGKRFGTLVHNLLAAVELDAGSDAVRAQAVLEGRVLGAPDDEVGAATETVVEALAHPLLKRAAAAARAGRCRRETPIALQLEDGILVEGVADAAFYEEVPEPAWTVVDFKTDVEIAGRLDEYRRQVGLYARAIAHSTGRPARGVLLRV